MIVMEGSTVLKPRWYDTRQTAEVLGFGVSKVKMLIASGELRSVKVGGHRRILPEWIEEYVERFACQDDYVGAA